MTIINPNSISGISSITALNSTAAINLFKADGTSANIIAGVTTGANFITGTSNVHSTGYECTNINASGIVTAASLDISGDIDVDGHTNLDNVNIAGVTTASGNISVMKSSGVANMSIVSADNYATLEIGGQSGAFIDLKSPSSDDYDIRFVHDGYIYAKTNINLSPNAGYVVNVNKNLNCAENLDVDGHTELDNVNISGVSTFRNELQISPSNASSYATHLNFNNTGSNFISCANSGATYFRNSSSGGTAMSIQGSDKSVDIDSTLRHLGDTDTLMQFGDNSITLSVGNEQAVNILPTSAGSGGARMGLGTNSPTGMLHIYGANPPVRIQNSNDSANLQFGMWDTANIMFQASNRTFKFATETSNDINFFTGGLGSSNERLRIASGGMITLGNPTNTVLKAEINNSVSGHYFVSQCSDNNNGFEIYQQHGSTTTRNTLAVYNNSTGSKHLNFYVRGDNQVWISTVKNNTALVLDGTSSGTYFGETGGRIEFLMLNEVNQFTGNFAARISPYLQRGNNGFGLKFDVRHNASTTYKALDLTADYSVLPGLDNTITLGSSSYRWSNIYTADLHCSNEGSKNDVDGTWGDYTIQEGESDLFLINNRSGKKYKFNLTEVS